MNAKELNFCLRLTAIPIILVLIAFPLMPVLFNWPAEMQKLSSMNQQIFMVHNAIVALLLLLQAIMLVRCPQVLTTPTQAGLALCWAMVLFWMLRLAASVVYVPNPFSNTSFKWAIGCGSFAPLLLLNGVYLVTLRHQMRAHKQRRRSLILNRQNEHTQQNQHHHTLTRTFDL